MKCIVLYWHTMKWWWTRLLNDDDGRYTFLLLSNLLHLWRKLIGWEIINANRVDRCQVAINAQAIRQPTKLITFRPQLLHNYSSVQLNYSKIHFEFFIYMSLKKFPFKVVVKWEDVPTRSHTGLNVLLSTFNFAFYVCSSWVLSNFWSNKKLHKRI